MPIRKDKQINNGGRLIIYMKNNICFKRTDFERNDMENIWVEINSVKSNFLGGLLYHPSNSVTEYWN